MPDRAYRSVCDRTRKLKALAKAPAKPGNQHGKVSGWARVFDETVPDELEIAELEPG